MACLFLGWLGVVRRGGEELSLFVRLDVVIVICCGGLSKVNMRKGLVYESGHRPKRGTVKVLHNVSMSFEQGRPSSDNYIAW